MLGAFILVASLLLAYMSLTIGNFHWGNAYRLKAVFNSASGVVKDGPVLLAGIEVGHVESMVVENNQAAMTLVLATDVKVFQDARATIRAKSLLGEKFIEIQPGTNSKPALANGQEIKHTVTPVELDEVLAHLSPVLTQIDPDDIKTLIHTAAAAVKGREKQLGDLIDGTSKMFKLVSDNESTLQRIIQNLDGVTMEANDFLKSNRHRLVRMINNIDRLTQSLNRDTPQLVNNLNRMMKDVQPMTTKLGQRGGQLVDSFIQITDDASQITRQIVSHPNLIPNMDASLTHLPGSLERVPILLDKLFPAIDQANNFMKKADRIIVPLEDTLNKANEIIDSEQLKKTLDEGLKTRTKLILW